MIASVSIIEQEPPKKAKHCSAIIEVRLKDGRLFSILAATPSWFKEAFAAAGLSFYFGPSILFLREVNSEIARQAVNKMIEQGDAWLCRYDTPRTTLAKVLADFKSGHS